MLSRLCKYTICHLKGYELRHYNISAWHAHTARHLETKNNKVFCYV